MGKKTWWFTIILLVLAGGAAYVWQPWRPKTSAPSAGAPPEAVASFREINETVLAMGKVLPQVGAEVKVGSRISGRLERLHVRVGDQIDKGRLIAEIEQKDLLAAVAQREAELALIRARLQALHLEGPQKVAKCKAKMAEQKAVLRYAHSEQERQRNLWGKKSIPKQAWEEAVRKYEVAKALHEVARQETELARCQYEQGVVQLEAEVARARAALEDARVQLSYARILSPLAGVIASVSTQEGETVAAGMNAPTFVTVLDLGRLQVDAYVDEVDIGKIKVGQKAWFTVESHPEKDYQARVRAILPKAVITDNVVTYDCILEILEPAPGELRPEMTANVTIITMQRPKVLMVPPRGVKRVQGGFVSYVRREGGYRKAPVAIGYRAQDWVEITSGLKPGDKVLLGDPPAAKEEPK